MDFNISTSTTFTYNIPGMDIAPGPPLFTHVSEFLSFITPEDLPLELVRDALHSNLTLIDFATNAIKIESGFIALMSIFVAISFIPLGATVAWCCGRNSSDEDYSNRVDPLMALDESTENALICRRRASILTMLIFFVILTYVWNLFY